MHVRIIANGNQKVFRPLTNYLPFALNVYPSNAFEPLPSPSYVRSLAGRGAAGVRGLEAFSAVAIGVCILLSVRKCHRVSDAEGMNKSNRPSVA